MTRLLSRSLVVLSMSAVLLACATTTTDEQSLQTTLTSKSIQSFADYKENLIE